MCFGVVMSYQPLRGGLTELARMTLKVVADSWILQIRAQSHPLTNILLDWSVAKENKNDPVVINSKHLLISDIIFSRSAAPRNGAGSTP